MSRNGVPSFAESLAGARRSAVHLERRDAYGVGDEAEELKQFKRTVVMRRTRIVSEPVTDHIRWEHAVDHQKYTF